MAAGEDVGFGTVYVNAESALARQAAELLGDAKGGAVVRIGHASAPRAARAGGSDSDADRWLSPWLARLCMSADVQPGVLLASSSMLAAAGYAIGELVRVQGVASGVTPAVHPTTLSFVGAAPVPDCEDIRSALLHALSRAEQQQLVLNVGVSVPDDSGRLLARLASFQAPAAESPIESAEVPLGLTRDVLAALEIECTAEPLSLDAGNEERQTAGRGAACELAGVDEFLGEAWQLVENALMSRGHGSGILLCGRRGSGKSSITQHLAQQAQHTQQCSRLVYCSYVDCTQLSMEPRTSAVRDELREIVSNAQVHQPSLLVLDDVESLLPAETEHGDSRRVGQLVDALVDALAGQDLRNVTVLATASGRAQVHARLFASGVFQSVLEIPAPGKAERELVLAAVARRSATPADLQDVNFSV
ncbi:Peroxisome biosynthesis protein pex1, partial [Coemansia nantahalensis]